MTGYRIARIADEGILQYHRGMQYSKFCSPTIACMRSWFESPEYVGSRQYIILQAFPLKLGLHTAIQRNVHIKDMLVAIKLFFVQRCSFVEVK